MREINILNNSRINLVLIGGCSRSGKSTLAYSLSEILKDNGIRVHIIKIDSWLISLEKRKANSTVLGRYDCKEIVKSIKKVIAGENIYPPVYDVNTRRRIAQHSKESICVKSGIVIVEGVVSLSLKELLDIASLRIFVSIAEEVRIRRLVDFYNKTKKLSLKETKSIVNSRELEEVPFVKKTAQYSDIVFEAPGGCCLNLHRSEESIDGVF